MSKIITLSIDLTKIDKTKIVNGKKGGKYINLVVAERKEADPYGNTHTLYIQQSKEERESQTGKLYVGSGKEFVFNSQPQGDQKNTEEDDLPF